MKEWCDLNKLSLNIKKTNYMIIKSPKKKLANAIEIKINNNDGTSTILERKDCVKYLGVLIDDKISWNFHISYICSRISKNTGIFYKLRSYLSLQQLKQLYYSLIYPYITYAIVAWGSTYQTHLKKIQIKQNHLIRLIFFATLYGKNTESALPLLNLLDLLTVNNIYRQQTLNLFTYGIQNASQKYLLAILHMPVMCIPIILDMQLSVTYTKLEAEQTLVNK